MSIELDKNDIMNLSSDIVDMFDNYLYMKGPIDSDSVASLSKEDYRSLCGKIYNIINSVGEDEG